MSKHPRKWATFCRRTNDPKLSWIEGQLFLAGIPYRRNGESWHAPIIEVPKPHMAAAWMLLPPEIDDAPDDLHVWTEAGLSWDRVRQRCAAYALIRNRYDHEQHQAEREAGEYAQ